MPKCTECGVYAGIGLTLCPACEERQAEGITSFEPSASIPVPSSGAAPAPSLLSPNPPFPSPPPSEWTPLPSVPARTRVRMTLPVVVVIAAALLVNLIPDDAGEALTVAVQESPPSHGLHTIPPEVVQTSELSGEDDGEVDADVGQAWGSWPLSTWRIYSLYYHAVRDRWVNGGFGGMYVARVPAPDCSAVPSALLALCEREDVRDISRIARAMDIYACENATGSESGCNPEYVGGSYYPWDSGCHDVMCLGNRLSRSFYMSLDTAGCEFISGLDEVACSAVSAEASMWGLAPQFRAFGDAATGWSVAYQVRGDGSLDGEVIEAQVFNRVDEHGYVSYRLRVTVWGVLPFSFSAIDDEVIPSHDPGLFDSWFEDLQISDGRIILRTAREPQSVGRWFTPNRRHTFRFEEGCVRLIGFDEMVADRLSATATKQSVNLLTRRGIWTDEAGRETSDTVSVPRLVCLGAMGAWSER